MHRHTKNRQNKMSKCMVQVRVSRRGCGFEDKCDGDTMDAMDAMDTPNLHGKESQVPQWTNQDANKRRPIRFMC